MATNRRLLPESAYDFTVRDGYDGEETGPFDTKSEAVAQLRIQRAKEHSWNRCRITLEWQVNERKVLRLLANRPAKKARRG